MVKSESGLPFEPGKYWLVKHTSVKVSEGSSDIGINIVSGKKTNLLVFLLLFLRTA